MRKRLSLIAVLILGQSGCATYSTLTNDAPHGSSGWYSGTRFNVALLSHNTEALMPYGRCEAPPYPAALDLPLSFVADTVAAVTRIFLVPSPSVTGFRALDTRR